MSLGKKDLEKIEAKVEEVARRLIHEGRRQITDYGKMTAKRLYAYPQLKRNIERYELDIEDVKKEEFGKSKSLVTFLANSGNGEPPTIEEVRKARINLIERKIYRDKAEIEEMDAAIDTIRDDPYFEVVERKFFKLQNVEEIAAAMSCGTATVSRNIGRLMDIMNISLYGADALKR